MKPEQKQQARQMYFQTNLTKTEIADTISVDRRTIYQWSVEDDWEKLRTSARNMPSILAEKCYYLIGHLTDHLLSKESYYLSVTKADVDMIHKLAKTINMLKKGSTINENMETFTWFLEGLQKRDAKLAEAVAPYADTFISCRAANSVADSVMNGYTQQGFKPFSEKDLQEKHLDQMEAEAILQEFRMSQTQNTATKNAGTENAAAAHAGAENFQPLHTGQPLRTDPTLHTDRSSNIAIQNNTAAPAPDKSQSSTANSKAEKDKIRKARYEAEKALKQDRKHGKAA